MDGTESCTWIIRSQCDLPGFAIKGDNTMTSGEAQISVLEWRDDFIDDADHRANLISPSYLKFFTKYPPKLSTVWMEKDDRTGTISGELGSWNNDTLELQYAGQWVMTQMKDFKDRYETFWPLRDAYDL